MLARSETAGIPDGLEGDTLYSVLGLTLHSKSMLRMLRSEPGAHRGPSPDVDPVRYPGELSSRPSKVRGKAMDEYMAAAVLKRSPRLS